MVTATKIAFTRSPPAGLGGGDIGCPVGVAHQEVGDDSGPSRATATARSDRVVRSLIHGSSREACGQDLCGGGQAYTEEILEAAGTRQSCRSTVSESLPGHRLALEELPVSW